MLNPIEYKIKEYELLCSLVSVEEIVQWADEEILRSDNLDEMIMDLSLANDQDKQFEVFSQLDSKYESEAFNSVTCKISELYGNKAFDFHEVSSKLILMSYHSVNLSSYQIDFCNWLDDETCLIAQGIKEQGPAETELKGFMEIVKSKHNQRLQSDLRPLSPFVQKAAQKPPLASGS